MSRSRQKRPYLDLYGNVSQKEWKQMSSRVFRRVSKQKIKDDSEPLWRSEQAISPYSFPDDGTKKWAGNLQWFFKDMNKCLRK